MAPAQPPSDQEVDGTLTPVNPDVFHDDHAIEDAASGDGVSSMASQTTRQTTHEPPVDQTAHTSRVAYPIRRRSMRKSLSETQDPFSSAEDDDQDDAHAEDEGTFAPYPSVRPLSSASSNVFAQTHSSHILSSGPSHPYNMYPQHTNLTRTVSVATQSIGHRSSLRPDATGRPSHPYAMYPQTVDGDIEGDASDYRSQRQQAIPVGFPGSLRALDRRTHPDPDTISISTNTEQLPPYSEYPEHGAPKPLASPRQSTTSPRPPQAPDQAHVPLLINIPPQSMSDARQTSSDLAQSTDRLLDGQPATPKRWRQKTWKQKRKTKFCGVPFGWILLSLGVTIFVTAVVGGFIGGFLRRQQERRARFFASLAAANGFRNLWHNPNATFFDASPLPASSTAPSLPSGTYSIQLGEPQEVQTSCLLDSQSMAWSCNLADAQNMAIQVGNVPGGQGAFVYSDPPADNGLGTQAPSTVFSMMQLVRDMDQPDLGEAYQFQVLYDKLVILPESVFGPSSVGYQKRDIVDHDKRAALDARDLMAGEKPWYCYWNGTLLEGFVYLDADHDSWTSDPTTGSSNCPSGTSSTTSGSAACSSHPPPPEGSNYPKSIKLEERRIAGSPSPGCTQMQVLDNGQVSPITDPATGALITIALQENDPSSAAYNNAGMASRKTKRDLVSGSCHCQWFTI